MCITNVALSMTEHTLHAAPDQPQQTYQYDDGWTVAAAVDPRIEGMDIDTIDTTAICVATDDAAFHIELTLPGPATEAQYHNGIITVEGQ